jgi:hypothetical protein
MQRSSSSRGGLFLGFCALALAAMAVMACSGGATAPAAAGPDGHEAQRPDVENPDDFTGDDEGPTAQVPGAGAPDTAQIVHTGTIELEVTDLRATVDQATALIGGLGGQIAESHEQNSSDYEVATVTYRIPAARWNEALAGLRGLGQKVLAEDTNAEDVTAQVIDLDARIANARTSEAALQAIMARATTIPDVLKVQGELTTIRGDIESMTAQRDHLADQAALGTLEVTFSVPIVATAAVAGNGWDLGREIDQALATLVRVGQGFASLSVWLVIVVLPVAIPVLLMIYVAVRVRRRFDARRSQQPLAPSI